MATARCPMHLTGHRCPGPRVFDSERHALPLSIAVDAAPAASVSALLLACCGASGVKGDLKNRWYVRSNPSSGNLHPVETYVLLNTRLYHYDALSHSLELRGANATAPVAVSKDAVVVLLSAISWREEWKYGLRGPRYTYLDAGHAIGAVLQAARAFGWIGICGGPPGGRGVGRSLGHKRFSRGARRGDRARPPRRRRGRARSYG